MTSFESPSHLVMELVTEEGRQWMIGFGSDAMTTAFPILITQITFFRILDENLFMPSITLLNPVKQANHIALNKKLL